MGLLLADRVFSVIALVVVGWVERTYSQASPLILVVVDRKVGGFVCVFFDNLWV